MPIANTQLQKGNSNFIIKKLVYMRKCISNTSGTTLKGLCTEASSASKGKQIERKTPRTHILKDALFIIRCRKCCRQACLQHVLVRRYVRKKSITLAGGRYRGYSSAYCRRNQHSIDLERSRTCLHLVASIAASVATAGYRNEAFCRLPTGTVLIHSWDYVRS